MGKDRYFINYAPQEHICQILYHAASNMHNLKKEKMIKNTVAAKRARFGYLFILPFLIGLVVIFIPNIVQTFLYSVNKIDPSTGVTTSFEGFAFYKDALKVDPYFTRTLINDLLGLLTNVPVILIYSLFIATLLNQKFAGRWLARLVFFYPVIMATGFMSVIDGDSAITTLGMNSIDSGATADLSNLTEITGMLSALYFPEPLINVISGAINGIYSITSSSGLQIFIFLAGLQNISPSLYEAAEIEGCSKWELFWKITFPMISPIIVMNLIYSIADKGADSQVFKYINDLALAQSQYSLAAAMSAFYLLCLGAMIALVLLIVNKLVVRPE